MAIKKLTDRGIATLEAKPDGAAAYYTDGYVKGLCVVVRGKRGSESRSFLFRATLNGQQLTMHLGPCAKMSLSKARMEAERCHNLIRAGQDPRQERAAQKAARKAKEDAGDSGGPPTVSKLLDLFFKKKIEKKRQYDTEGIRLARIARTSTLFDRVRKTIGKMAVADVKPQTLDEQILAKLFETNPSSALELRRLLRKVFRMAVSLEWIAKNPAGDALDDLLSYEFHESTPHPALDYVDGPRFVAELKAYKNPGRGMADRALTTVPALLFLTYAAVRIEEVILAQWGEIDEPNLLWKVPADHRKKRKGGDKKKHKDRAIPISEPMLEVLKEMERRYPDAGPDNLIFPGRGRNGGLSRGSTLRFAKQIVKSFKPEAHITQHGFRAMFKAWHTAQRRYPAINVERQFDHTVGGIDFDKALAIVGGYDDHNRPGMTDPTIEGELGRREEMECYGEYLTSYKAPAKCDAAITARPAQRELLP